MKNVCTLTNAKSFNPPHFEEKRSPFSIYPNETLLEETQYASPHPGGSVQDDLDKLILYLINRFLFTTSALLKIALDNLNIELEKVVIQNHLKNLVNRQFLRSYRFVSNENCSAGKVYSLGWRGYGYIKNTTSNPYLRKYAEELVEKSNTVQIKRILAAQQVALKNKCEIEHLDICKAVFVPTKDGQSSTKCFRPHAMVLEDKLTFLESVRRSSNWKKELLEKIARINTTLQSSRPLNIPIQKEKSSLILIGEDLQHMTEIMNLLQSTYCWFPIALYYTADTMEYNNHPYIYEIRKKESWFSKLFVS